MKLESFVQSATDSAFSLYNLPYGVFRRKGTNAATIGTAIGDYVLDLGALEQEGLLNFDTKLSLFNQNSLNTFAAQSSKVWSSARRRIQLLLSADNNELQGNSALLAKALIPNKDIEMLLPFEIGGFTDFYASENHATNVGKLFRKNEAPLLPNWKHLPIGYNGRASTVFPSGTQIVRPRGQIKAPDQPQPEFAPTRKLDFELELGVFIGTGNPDGTPITVDHAKSHIFGLVLLNDWSARDVQAFEYQPLGPFLSKGFATSISPWVIPFEALEDSMVPIPPQDPQPVSYLMQQNLAQPDIRLMVELQPRGSTQRTIICETAATQLYWSMEQMLAHHTVNNCIMRPGDLFGTGTISGTEKGTWGSLLEITFNGAQPLVLNDKSERTFLEDGDTVIFTGYCQTKNGKIGFGSLEGTILPAR